MADFEMPKTYDPSASERRIYEWWEQSGFFKPEIAGAERRAVRDHASRRPTSPASCTWATPCSSRWKT